jgi:plastocyanin
MHRRSLLTLAGTAVVPLAGCSGDGGGNHVEMTDEFDFAPTTATIQVGETLTWENVGSVGHTVTAYEDGIPADAGYFASGEFDSEEAARDSLNGGIVEAGETYDHTFEVAGTYEYFCVPHEGSGMTGTVQVER